MTGLLWGREECSSKQAESQVARALWEECGSKQVVAGLLVTPVLTCFSHVVSLIFTFYKEMQSKN